MSLKFRLFWSVRVVTSVVLRVFTVYVLTLVDIVKNVIAKTGDNILRSSLYNWRKRSLPFQIGRLLLFPS